MDLLGDVARPSEELQCSGSNQWPGALHWLSVAVVGKTTNARLIAGQCQPDLRGG
ncbi:Hypothetical protein SMAX5B_000452 [Scophthalmus maximus]|uniref:Uncharacterized protein n=1 Tax=Scophthalmus maximus TaxID=52904 RepID=A0A2U9CKQ3_SCOMX|nr:Hypothetical protein SMAX5B_000452 [Scophthalmus maximus]